MNSNYEAQKHLTRQRLAARREQAEVERLLKEVRPARTSGFKQFLASLFARKGPFRRSDRRDPEKQTTPPRLAITGKGKS